MEPERKSAYLNAHVTPEVKRLLAALAAYFGVSMADVVAMAVVQLAHREGVE